MRADCRMSWDLPRVLLLVLPFRPTLPSYPSSYPNVLPLRPTPLVCSYGSYSVATNNCCYICVRWNALIFALTRSHTWARSKAVTWQKISLRRSGAFRVCSPLSKISFCPGAEYFTARPARSKTVPQQPIRIEKKMSIKNAIK